MEGVSKVTSLHGAQTSMPTDRRRVPFTRAELSHIALELFHERGFDETTMDDIAAAAGIGRRTLFRYFSSKNELPWGDFDHEIEQMRAHLANIPESVPLARALRNAIVDFNRFPESEVIVHRERMRLLLSEPSLVAHSALRYASWRQVIAEFVARRTRLPEGSLDAQIIGWTCLGASISAYEQWLSNERLSLPDLIHSAFDKLELYFSDGR